MIATGDNFPDALSASAAAGVLGKPVILVDGWASTLDAATSSYLESHKVSSASIIGGTSAVSAGVQSRLASSGVTVNRLEGSDRFLTASAVNRSVFSSAPTLYIASGVDFPDALAGAAIAAAKKSPLYVARPGCVPRNVGQDILALGSRSVVLIGGTAALSTTAAALAQCQ
jgi:putative cell wall-binding protein